MSGIIFEDILEEVGRLLDLIPLVNDIPSNGKFIAGFSMDSPVPIERAANYRILTKDRQQITFRDIVKILSELLLALISSQFEGESGVLLKPNQNPTLWQAIVNLQRYRQLVGLGSTYPMNYLLFDFCLAALAHSLTDARLYLAHSLHILGLHKSIALLLSVVINESLTKDKDVRELLALLGKLSEPRNAHEYVRVFGSDFKQRYESYRQELAKLMSQHAQR